MPGKESPDPSKLVHEARCIPGGLIGCGSTRVEALAKLDQLIVWTLTEEKSPSDWYQKAWDRMTDYDRFQFGGQFASASRALRPERSNRVRDVAVNTLEPVPC